MDETLQENNWYYTRDGQAVGPITLSQLRQLHAVGQLAPDDQVSRDNVNWMPVQNTPELQSAPLPSAATVDASPQSLSYPAPLLSNPQVSGHAIDLLGQTSLWVRIMSILMFIGIIFMVIAALIVGALGLINSAPSGAASPFLLAIVYLAMAALYTVPALYLSRYATHAKAFARQREMPSLEDALQAQKSFWKFVTLMILIIFGLEIIAIPVFMVAVVMTHHV